MTLDTYADLFDEDLDDVADGNCGQRERTLAVRGVTRIRLGGTPHPFVR